MGFQNGLFGILVEEAICNTTLNQAAVKYDNELAIKINECNTLEENTIVALRNSTARINFNKDGFTIIMGDRENYISRKDFTPEKYLEEIYKAIAVFEHNMGATIIDEKAKECLGIKNNIDMNKFITDFTTNPNKDKLSYINDKGEKEYIRPFRDNDITKQKFCEKFIRELNSRVKSLYSEEFISNTKEYVIKSLQNIKGLDNTIISTIALDYTDNLYNKIDRDGITHLTATEQTKISKGILDKVINENIELEPDFSNTLSKYKDDILNNFEKSIKRAPLNVTNEDRLTTIKNIGKQLGEEIVLYDEEKFKRFTGFDKQIAKQQIESFIIEIEDAVDKVADMPIEKVYIDKNHSLEKELDIDLNSKENIQIDKDANARRNYESNKTLYGKNDAFNATNILKKQNIEDIDIRERNI